MKNAFEWLVRHEKFVIVVTALLVVALGLQTYLKRNRTLEISSPDTSSANDRSSTKYARQKY